MEHISKFLEKWKKLDERSLEEKIYDLLEKIDAKIERLESRVMVLEDNEI